MEEKKEKEKKLLCPMKFSICDSNFEECEEEKCAWWHQGSNTCCLLEVTMCLISLTHQIGEI
ncbi:MAG: hypothetical protein ACFFDT_31445 [Candidatus Hodarchaeota archaeon]